MVRTVGVDPGRPGRVTVKTVSTTEAAGSEVDGTGADGDGVTNDAELVKAVFGTVTVPMVNVKLAVLIERLLPEIDTEVGSGVAVDGADGGTPAPIVLITV